MTPTFLHIVQAKVWGGGEQYVYDISRELTKRRYRVLIVVDKTNTEMQKRFSEVGQVRTMNLYSLSGLFSLRALCQLIRDEKVDILNCHSGHAAYLCLLVKLLTNTKLVLFKHNAQPSKIDFYHTLLRKHTSAVICVSKLVYQLQTQNLPDSEKRKFHIVHNGIDVDKFQNIHNHRSKSDQFTIGYAGRIVEDKGIKILLDAFIQLRRQYNNVILKLAGKADDSFYKELEKTIVASDSEDSIQFTGFINNIEDFYAGIDLFILPSIVREAFGLVLCEAMYCNIPVITTNSGAQDEIIENDISGILIPPNDEKALFIQMDRIYNDSTLRENLSRNGKNRVMGHFTIDVCVNKLINIYSRICSDNA